MTKKNGAFLPIAIGTGIAVGTALGLALDNLALGISMGVAIGAGLGVTMMGDGKKGDGGEDGGA